MKIKEIHVKNFRSILDETLTFDDLTILVGRNGSGKSTFLKAVELFYDTSPKIVKEDFYSEKMENPIEIMITYCDLSGAALTQFSKYEEDGELKVVRVVALTSGGISDKYHGIRRQNSDFDAVRNASSKSEKNKEYAKLKEKTKYKDLPTIRRAEELENALEEWESNKDNYEGELSLGRDEGNFFGFKQVGQGYLRRFTRFILIPAVKDAQEDSIEGKGTSAIKQLMNLTVRNALKDRQEIAEFYTRVQDDYSSIYDTEKIAELKNLSDELSLTLKKYVEDAKINLQWQELADISIPEPDALIKLVEDGYTSTVPRVGHGLQRALIFTLLQHLVTTDESKYSMNDSDGNNNQNGITFPNLVLAIEEPELYQHPSRQRYFSQVLRNLTEENPEDKVNKQVLFTTHSPLLIGIDNFDSIRVVRKFDNKDNPKITKLLSAEMDEIAKKLWEVNGEKGPIFTSETLRPRLRSIMTPWMNEGFFADVVVLVEGVSDRAAILGAAAAMEHDLGGHNLDSLGITIIPCYGKNNIDRPYLIFSALNIPTYIIWDGDFEAKDSKPDINRYLLKLLDKREEDWPDFIGERATCLKRNLENKLEEEIGKDEFSTILNEIQEELGIPKKEHAMKNPEVIKRIVGKVSESGDDDLFLKAILNEIVNLRNK